MSGRVSDYLKYRQLETKDERMKRTDMDMEVSAELTEGKKQKAGKGKENAGFY